jgi:hypothetical protein
LSLIVVSIGRAQSVEYFGLEHFPFGAAVTSNEFAAGFFVSDLEFTGSRGSSTKLGAADSGAFFYPNVASVDSGYFMRAGAFGKVGEQDDAPIGMVSGYRTDYATFFAQADFSAIGATSLTYQLWYGNLMLRETTVASGELRLYAYYSHDMRVNPWWRQPGGDYGASIQFRNAPSVQLPGCGEWESCESFFPTRIFIRPNGATGVVHSVSRVDIVGGGGLPGYGVHDVRLGMFGHAHAAVGAVKLVATNATLRLDITNLWEAGGSGAFVELENSAVAEVHLLPLDLAPPNTNAVQERLDVNLSGTFSSTSLGHVGAAALINSNGTLHLSAYLYEVGPLLLTVFSNGVPVGTPNMDVPEPVQITGGPRLIAVGANADRLSSPSGLTFTFESPVVFHTVQGELVGDRVRLQATNWIRLAHLNGLALTAQALPAITITGETSASEVPTLSIVRSNDVVYLRWPDPAAAYVVEFRPGVGEGSWTRLETITLTSDGFATVAWQLAGSGTSGQFFRLARYARQD